MNVIPQPHPGARVQVTWTDGRLYPGTVVSLAQGQVQVQFDSGGAPAWVPLHVVAPLMMQHHAPAPVFAPAPVRPAASPPAPIAAPAPVSAAVPAPVSSRAAGTVAIPVVPPAPVPAVAPVPAPAPAPAPPATSAPQGPAPRPLSRTLRNLPRGLVYEPTASGPGDGQAFFVLFGFGASADTDLVMRMNEIDHIGDDVAALRAAGYRVLVDLHGDLTTLADALLGKHPDASSLKTAGIYWSGHGDTDGTIQTHEGLWIAPEQIPPEVAKEGHVKLFVMSACDAGSHTPRWQKAIGPQAQIIGWGAPITIARAIEFLVPDAANAKGLDDLLARHLGAKPVGADAPLTEVHELARKHEDALATLLLPLDELAPAAQARLKCKMEKMKEGGGYWFEVRTPPSKDYPNTPRSQVVRATGWGAGDAWIYLKSLVGPYSDALDLARGIRLLTPTFNVRMILQKGEGNDPELIFVDMLLRRKRLDAVTFANSLINVAVNADKLEDLFFGSDKR